MGHLETRREADGVRYFLGGLPVKPGQALEILTLWGWRKGFFIPGDPPTLRARNGEPIVIEANDQVRRPESPGEISG